MLFFFCFMYFYSGLKMELTSCGRTQRGSYRFPITNQMNTKRLNKKLELTSCGRTQRDSYRFPITNQMNTKRLNKKLELVPSVDDDDIILSIGFTSINNMLAHSFWFLLFYLIVFYV